MLISERTNTSTIERWCALVILALGALHCLAARQYLNADGMSYIEVAENLLHFGRESVNSYFSPLYSWMLIPLIALHPGPYWELPLVQCVNFAILILALACFRFFFRQLTLRFTPVSPAAWILIGYSMFAWCALYMISPRLMTPDMLYASILFLIFGLLLKIFAGDHSWRVAIVLGILWGGSYWFRAAFMPLFPF